MKALSKMDLDSRSLYNSSFLLYREISEVEGGYEKFFFWVNSTKGLTKRATKAQFDILFNSSFDNYVENKSENEILLLELRKWKEEYFKERIYDQPIGLEEIHLNEEGFFESKVIGIPTELLTSFQQYFLFFNDYVKVAKGLDVLLDVIRIDQGLKFILKSKDNKTIENVKFYLDEYLLIAKETIVNGSTNLKDKVEINDSKEKDLLILKFQQQINHLEQNLNIAKLENKFLERETTVLERIALNFSERDIKLSNYVIQETNPDFSKKVKNINIDSEQFVQNALKNSIWLDQKDLEILGAIDQYAKSENEKEELVLKLNDIKSKVVSPEKKKESGQVLKKFIETITIESSKHLLKILFERGHELISFIS